MMPRHLIVLRHGQSQGNVMEKNPAIQELLKDVPNHQFRLTEKGVEQAKIAGEWLQNYLQGPFIGGTEIAGYVSTFVRAKETAGNLRLGLKWRRSPFIVERDWGNFNSLAAEDQARVKAAMKKDPIHLRKPNGESLSHLLVTNYLFFGKLHREHPDDAVIAVCHGERFLTIRYQLENFTDRQMVKLLSSSRISDRVKNCQLLEYSRVNPETNEEIEHYGWMRSFCPWELRDKDLHWKKIVRAKMTDDDLLAYAEQFPRFSLEGLDS